MQFFSSIADIVTLLTAAFSGFFAFRAWRQTMAIREAMLQEVHRQNRKIQIVLQCGNTKYELPVPLRRADFTRAEILGHLGMIPMKEPKERFSLSFLSTPEFARRINEISVGEGDSVLTIPCRDEEMEQFAFPSI